MRPPRHADALIVLIALVAPAGCGPEGDGLPREPISGTVHFDGEPIASGTIQFHPASHAEGMAAGGMIVDGRFNVPRHEGPVPGTYKVQIYSLDDAGPVAPSPTVDEEGMPGAFRIPAPRELPRRAIPARYNSQSELVAEVKAGEPNTYTFALEP